MYRLSLRFSLDVADSNRAIYPALLPPFLRSCFRVESTIAVSTIIAKFYSYSSIRFITYCCRILVNNICFINL